MVTFQRVLKKKAGKPTTCPMTPVLRAAPEGVKRQTVVSNQWIFYDRTTKKPHEVSTVLGRFAVAKELAGITGRTFRGAVAAPC